MSLGFYFDGTRCVGCKACQVACKDRLNLQKAGPRPRRVATFEVGTFPTVQMFHVSLGCNHCEEPACVAMCPTGAMFKAMDGIVLHDDDICIQCQTCVNACPYNAPQVADELDGLIVKCDSCQALREVGMNPVCVDACAMRALDFGDLDDLRSTYGDDLVNEISSLPSATETTPNLIIRAKEASLDDNYREITL